jgi:hypothetical protein
MASNFPAGIDTFTNPVYTKIDGEDVVNASHVNDLQDAVRAVQEVVAGAGKVLDFSSNNFIVDDSSYKAALEALDAAIGTTDGNLTAHIGYVLVSDPVQHHANVIDVTATGNLTSTRVQTALVEHQQDIDNIMTGGTVNTVTLDDRYVGKSGAQSMQGALTVTTDLNVDGNTVLGNAGGDTVTITDIATIGGTLDVTGVATFDNNILMQAGQKIAEEGATSDSYIAFETDRLEFYSHGNVDIRLDADDATDGQSDASLFRILNGANSLVFSVDELGDVVANDISAADITSSSSTYNFASAGSITNTALSVDGASYKISIDDNNNDGTARFFIVNDGDTGASLASADLLLNVNESSELVTGTHILKSGIQETGYFGLKVYSDNAGGVFFGAGVNFKTEMTNEPSSITLTPDVGSANYQNLSVTDITKYGFFFEFDTPATGAADVFGTYATVGN